MPRINIKRFEQNNTAELNKLFQGLPSESKSNDDDDEEEDEEAISWQRIVGTRRKSMGPQFAMTHF